MATTKNNYEVLLNQISYFFHGTNNLFYWARTVYQQVHI